jgi:NAD(P)-dependent dehydrogenase (short-subunit alcohol dehydrogenase family)
MRTDQTIVAVSADLSDYEEARRAIQQAVEHQNGQAPDLTIMCAGFAKAGLFTEVEPNALKQVCPASLHLALELTARRLWTVTIMFRRGRHR